MEVDVKPNEDGSGDLKKQRNKNFLIVISVILLTAGGTSIVLALLIQEGEETFSLKAYRKAACKKENPTIVDVNACFQANCTFDTSICETPCPFGYSADESRCTTSCECAESGVYQGDLAFGPDEVMDLAERYGYAEPQNDFALFHGTLKTSVMLWTEYPYGNGRYKIPYTVAPEFENNQKVLGFIKQSAEALSRRTCIDLVEKTDEIRWLIFKDEKDGCFAFLGKSHFTGGQRVSLADGCHQIWIFEHEIMHSLGFSHTHVRPDRDGYIEVLWDTFDEKMWFHMDKLKKEDMVESIVPYEVDSVMHYGGDCFTVDPDKLSMVERATGVGIPPKIRDSEYTDMDIHLLNVAYGCLKESYSASWTDWDQWSACDATCGAGEKHRYRKCEDAEGQYAIGCNGEAHEIQKCEGACGSSVGSAGSVVSAGSVGSAVSAVWEPWEHWGVCKGPCGFGYRVRNRKCSGSGECGKKSVEHGECDACGGASVGTQGGSSSQDPWGQWTSCSATCDGTRHREKECQQAYCPSAERQSENCNVGFCGFASSGGDDSLFEREEIDVKGYLCGGGSGTKWIFGDFNGDGHRDVLCFDATGDVTIGSIDENGQLNKISARERITGCENAKKYVGDFNGDGKDDILCKNEAARKLTVSFMTLHGSFDSNPSNAGTFCTDASDRLIIMDVNKDKAMDLLCHFNDNHIEVRLNVKSS